jgi:hypothetical protein
MVGFPFSELSNESPTKGHECDQKKSDKEVRACYQGCNESEEPDENIDSNVISGERRSFIFRRRFAAKESEIAMRMIAERR